MNSEHGDASSDAADADGTSTRNNDVDAAKEARVNPTEGTTGRREPPLDSYRLFRVRFDRELQCQVRELLGEYPEEEQALSQLDRLRSSGGPGADATYEIARHAPPAYWFFQQRQLRQAGRPQNAGSQQRAKRSKSRT